MPTGIYKRTKEHRKKLSKAHIGEKQTEERIRKRIEKNRGQKRSKEQKERISNGQKALGEKHWTKRPEVRKKMSENRMGKITGESHWNWKGGISRLKIYKHYKNGEYINWRRKVFERDKYICLNCGISGVYLHPHHIKSYTYYPEDRYDVENGITLCVPCHHQLHFGN